jgi:hypothetical protein
MNPKTVIKGKIHYVGVNDRNKHLFEGMGFPTTLT